MQAKFTTAAEYRQERDFGNKVGATFEFLGAHWRPLGKCLAYFVVPASLLVGLALGISQSRMFGAVLEPQTAATSAERLQQLSSNTFGAFYWLGIFGSLITYSLLGATIYGYVRVRQALPPDEEVTPRLVGEQIGRFAPRLALSGLLTGVLIMIGFVLLFVPGIYLAVGLSLTWAVQVLEDTGTGHGFRRSLHLLKGNWWATLGLTLIMSFIIGIMAMVFQIPQYLSLFGKALHWSFLSSDALLVASTMLSSVVQMLLYSTLFLALLFQYYNLVEKKEGVGLRSLVDSLGTTPVPVAYSHTYRPDDEGEY